MTFSNVYCLKSVIAIALKIWLWVVNPYILYLISYVIFFMILSLKGLQVFCSHNFQVLEIYLSIVQISKTNFCDPLKYFLFEFFYTMNKSRVSQEGKLEVFPTYTQNPEGIFLPKVLLKLNLENPTIKNSIKP